MQPAPLTGTATTSYQYHNYREYLGCNPRPSRGQQRHAERYHVQRLARCNPHPSRGRQPLDGNDLRQTAEEMQPAPLTGTATRSG